MTRRALAAAAALLVPISATAQISHSQRHQRTVPVLPGAIVRTNGPITQRDITAVLLAIKDEIYAGGCAPLFSDIGKPVGQGKHEIDAYFRPTLTDGMSSVIYKFWPFGEVNRMYWIDKAGLSHLAGHPTWGFPATEPSYLTIYMSDQELSRAKATWRRVALSINISPSRDRVRQAKQRQIERGGDLHVCRGRWQGNIFVPQDSVGDGSTSGLIR